MTRWQPIETAPKDGTSVLLWWNGSMFVGAWGTGEENKGWYSGEDYVPATNWMPLPNPPQ